MELRDLIDAVNDAINPDQACDRLASMVKSETGATRASIYLLDLASGAYRLKYRTGEPEARHKWAIVEGAKNTDPLSIALATGRGVYRTRIESDGWFDQASTTDVRACYTVPASRSGSYLGAILLELSEAPESFDARAALLTDAAAQLIVAIYEKRLVFRRLRHSVSMVRLDADRKSFLNEIAEVAGRSAGMEFVAIRELSEDGQRLDAVSLQGFGEQDYSKWGFSRTDAHAAPFWSVADSSLSLTVPSISDDPSLARLKDLAAPVESFVCVPITTSSGVWGTLSLAARCRFNYTELEAMAFESLATGVGMALDNRDAADAQAETAATWRELAQALTSVQLARAVRHEVKLYIGNSQEHLWQIRKGLDRPKDAKAVNAARNEIQGMSNGLRSIYTSLERITDPMNTSQEEEWVSLDSVWGEVVGATRGKLNQMRIDAPTPGGPSIEVLAYSSHIRTAITNLVLNSIDAFSETRKMSNRRVGLRVLPIAERDNDVTIAYTDSAGGLREDLLKRKAREAEYEGDLAEFVFHQGVTTKSDGNGYGLWLVRSFLGDCKIGIVLHTLHKTDRTSRTGIEFRISVPHDRARAARDGNRS